MSSIFQIQFKEIVEQIFNRWTALKMAVEYGMGGRNGHQTAIELMKYITDYCLQNDNLSPRDVQDCMEEIMDQEFQTVCEDNSVQEISFVLIKYLNYCKEGRYNDALTELSQLGAYSRWLCPGAKITYAAVQMDSSESDSEDDEDMEMEGNSIVTDMTEGPSSSGSTTQMIEEDADWTTIKTRRKK